MDNANFSQKTQSSGITIYSNETKINVNERDNMYLNNHNKHIEVLRTTEESVSLWHQFAMRVGPKEPRDLKLFHSATSQSIFEKYAMDPSFQHDPNRIPAGGVNPLNPNWYYEICLGTWGGRVLLPTSSGPFIPLPAGTYEATWDFYIVMDSDYPPLTRGGVPQVGITFDCTVGFDTRTVVQPFTQSYYDMWMNRLRIVDSTKPNSREGVLSAVATFATEADFDKFAYRVSADTGMVADDPNATFPLASFIKTYLYLMQMRVIKLG